MRKTQPKVDRQTCPSGQEAHRGRTIGAQEVVRQRVMCRGCDKEDGTDKHRVDRCLRGQKLGMRSLSSSEKRQWRKNTKQKMKVARKAGAVSSEEREVGDQLLDGEKSGRALPTESLRDHITIDGSLKGIPGKHGACGWPVVQPRFTMESSWPMHGLFGPSFAKHD